MQSHTERRWRVAVIGGKGLLGSGLVAKLGKVFDIVSINKDNYQENIGTAVDVLINANGNSKRFWADQNVFEDFSASTVSVYRSIFDFNFQKYIYISSSDVYEDHTDPKTTSEIQSINSANLSPYGFHKYLSEQIVRRNVKDFIILRCSMMLGEGLRKGPFYDVLNGNPLFVTPPTRLQLITTEEVANVVLFLLRSSYSREILNTGGRGTFSFQDLKKHFSIPVSFSPEASLQEYEMNVAKLTSLYPLRTSEEYLSLFLREAKG